MNNEVKELLLKVLEKCFEISNTTDADVFFNYSSHTNCLAVYYYENGWKEDEMQEYIIRNEDITKKNLEKALTRLNELGEKKNNGI